MSYLPDLVKLDRFDAAQALGKPASIAAQKRRLLAGLAIVALLAGGVELYRSNSFAAPAPAANAPTPVSVETASIHNVRIWSEFSGRMTAVNSAEIRPQVTGRITEIRFKDGQQVNAGDVLLVIDPAPYAAAVAKAEADLATANNNVRLADVEMERAERLKAAQAIAQDLYDTRANAKGVALAAVQAAEAEFATAKVDLDHAYVKAPISGRVGRAEITVGNLVQTTTNPPLLTTIVSNDGIYADFDVDEQTYLQSIRSHAANLGAEQKVPVEITLAGDDRSYQGTIESFDNQIATGTGTIRARARFDNADGALVPGMFVTVRMAAAANSHVILVPENAVGNDQSKRFVYVVGRDSRAEFREVDLGREVDGERVVQSGLKPGERVITDGLQRVQPGSIVAVRTEANRQFAQR
jgi:multidrug efflux system membrane fusion protein